MAAIHRQVRQRLVERAFWGLDRVLKDRQNPLETLPGTEVFRRYRFRPRTILYITDLVSERVAFISARNFPLPALLQVLVFLRFLATGSFQLLVGDSLDLSQSTVCRCCRRVGRALASLSHRFVSFPTGEAATITKQRFRNIAGFPNVLGCVDGTHVRIAKPKENENEYINRKGYHSLNVQMICDADFQMVSLTAKWPGSTHDARIWRDCSLRQQFENGIHNGFLLGDSGYPCKPYLMTPYLHPGSPLQERFNTSLCRTRVLIEQTFGILKKIFPVLHFGIRSDPPTAVQYTTSCVVLHNIGFKSGDIIHHDIDLDIPINKNDLGNDINQTGNHIRQQIAERFFN